MSDDKRSVVSQCPIELFQLGKGDGVVSPRQDFQELTSDVGGFKERRFIEASVRRRLAYLLLDSANRCSVDGDGDQGTVRVEHRR